MKYIVVDLEMNPIDRKYRLERGIVRQEIIEIGAAALNENYEEIGTFKTYVKPAYNSVIKKNIEQLTGISTSMVWSQPTFAQAIKAFFAWCDSFHDQIRICQWSENDLVQVLNEMILKDYRPAQEEIPWLLDWEDLQHMYDSTFEKRNPTALSEAITGLNLNVEGKLHDALYDAKNTAAILRVLSDRNEVARIKENRKAYCSPDACVCTLGDLFDFSQFAVSA